MGAASTYRAAHSCLLLPHPHPRNRCLDCDGPRSGRSVKDVVEHFVKDVMELDTRVPVPHNSRADNALVIASEARNLLFLRSMRPVQDYMDPSPQKPAVRDCRKKPLNRP